MSTTATMENKEDIIQVEKLNEAKEKIKGEIKKVIVGQDEIIESLLICLLCEGHCLLIGVPGLAKTLLIKTIAEALKLSFNRIQFTPDLMPSDITGTDILEQDGVTGKRSFRFIKGPVFTQILLADEINRTPPKTQAALLEAMQEHKVTAGGETFTLERPFFVLATQNPIEQEGTYPLPEAQLDRFMFNVWIDYPSVSEEEIIVQNTTSAFASTPNKVLKGEDILRFQQLVRKVPVSQHVIQYAVKLVTSTRPTTENAPSFIKDWVRWGAGPRASQYLILGAKARAVLDARYTPDIADVKTVAVPVLRHRLIANFNAESENITSKHIIEKLLEEVKE